MRIKFCFDDFYLNYICFHTLTDGGYEMFSKYDCVHSKLHGGLSENTAALISSGNVNARFSSEFHGPVFFFFPIWKTMQRSYVLNLMCLVQPYRAASMYLHCIEVAVEILGILKYGQ